MAMPGDMMTSTLTSKCFIVKSVKYLALKSSRLWPHIPGNASDVNSKIEKWKKKSQSNKHHSWHSLNYSGILWPIRPLTACNPLCGSTSLLSLKTLPVLTDKENFDILLVQEEEIFKTIPERAQFSQEDRKKDKKQYKVNTKVLTKISFYSPPTFPSIYFFLPKRFPEIISHLSRVNAQQKNQKKTKEEGRRGSKKKQSGLLCHYSTQNLRMP